MVKENTQDTFDYVYNIIKKISDFDKKGTILERGLKLSEETGELSAEILKSTNYKYHNNTQEEIRNNILLESSDCLIIVFDILNKLGFTKSEIIQMIKSQLKKWEKQI